MIGRTLRHYEITALIGRGGMGEVYRARDTRLKRDVAIKILPADMAADPVRLERFQREAETVAGLTHAHIVTLYSVEEAEGVRFLTMELVEGQTLDAMIPEGGLGLKQVFEIGTAVADALAAAHEKGIVHRDLKPSNVMIAQDGRIKVLDFGLAKLSMAAVSDSSMTVTSPITAEGSVMGTVPYMSPEQLRGRDVDHRSDIFSLGIMLYEMASAKRPFAGDSNSDISSSILRDIPPPLDEVRPGLPHHLARIVSHCLEKDPRDRYHSAADVRNELRALRHEVESGAHMRESGRKNGRSWTGFVVAAAVVVAAVALWLAFREKAPASVTSVDAPPSIAVLPFANMSGDASQDYFSDGISEELLNLLAQIPALKVAARTSSFSFKGQNVEVPEIGRRLNVTHVLEGSVRRAGDQVRITAQLIHAADGFHVWSQTYDRKFDDIFAIQDEIAADVTRQLQIALLDQKTPTARKTNAETYGLYLHAIQLTRAATDASLKEAEQLLRDALTKDPAYAPAWDALCGVYITQLSLGMMANEEGSAKVREAATQTVHIDPDYAPAYARLAWIAIYDTNDFAEAAKQLEHGLSLDPNDSRVLSACSVLLENLGRLEEGMAIERELAERDPLNPTKHLILGITQRRLGQFDAAVASFNTAITLSPERGGLHYQISIALLQKGDARGALAAIEKENDGVWSLIGKPAVYCGLGKKAEAVAAFDSLITTFERDAPSNIAADYAMCGEVDKAFQWMEKAIEYKDPGVYEVTDNILSGMHNDPRWLPFLKKINRAPEQLAKIKFKVTLPADTRKSS